MANRKQSAKGRVVGSSGRFGPRYGRFIRKRVNQIEKISRARHSCPRCDQMSVQREGTGIWVCRKCGFKFAGGTYVPETPAMRVATRSIERAMQKEG
jgi:large subunit ribosomal protein L37Ae